MNISLASRIIRTLAHTGVEDIIICAGARNSPLVYILEKAQNVQVWSFFEERSAAFFALGISQKKQKPVAVITTSGTAVAELLPAAVEATYTQTPLIFVTADRPREYRGTGAPQSIDQVGIFSRYVETCFDVAHAEEKFDIQGWSQRAPLQINVCFSEPLIDEDISLINFKNEARQYFPVEDFFSSKKINLDQALVIAGSLNVEESKELEPHLLRLGFPIYAEAQSNLRQISSLKNLLLNSGEKIVEEIFRQGYCQSVLRVGGVPTLRFWRDLEEKYKHLQVTSISPTDFTGLSRSVHHVVGLKNISFVQAQWSQDLRAQIFAIDKAQSEKLKSIINQFPSSEVSLIYQLLSSLAKMNVYVGNSLPIRELDLVSGLVENSPNKISANRGANGIDGQISTFLGLSEPSLENWALVGDLTAMYDLTSPWISPHLQDHILRIVVINNQGGQIFKNMFQKDIFLNRHQIDFSHWAKMWNWAYQSWKQVPQVFSLKEKHMVIELIPDATQSESFWKAYQQL